LNNIDVSDIYDQLKAIRQNPNRIEIVTNQVLESNTKQKTAEKPTSNVFMQDFVKIIDLTTTNMSLILTPLLTLMVLTMCIIVKLLTIYNDICFVYNRQDHNWTSL